MLCNICGGYSSDPWKFTKDNDGNHVHISCVSDNGYTVKQDTVVLFQALVIGFLGSNAYEQCKTDSIGQALHDGLIPCFGGSPVDTFSESMVVDILWNISDCVGFYGYECKVDMKSGIFFVNKTKSRTIMFKFAFGQIRGDIDSVEYNNMITEALMGDGVDIVDTCDEICMWNERKTCRDSNCCHEFTKCLWNLNMWLSLDYIELHHEPLINFFNESYEGLLAVCCDGRTMSGIMTDFTEVFK